MVESRDDAVGLCARCRHARTVKTAAALYWRCELSKTDPRFAKYPRLPVIECPGFEPREEEPGPATPSGPPSR